MRVERCHVCAPLLIGVLYGCGGVAVLTRAEGDGGWSAERRAEELARFSSAAGESVAAEPPARAGPLDLATALRLADAANREIAAARIRLDGAEQGVWRTRGNLLPTTTGSGRYTWYTDPQVNQLDLPAGLAPGGTPPAVTIRESELGVLNGTVSLPLDVSGELRHMLRAAQAGFRGERARLWATTLEQQALVVRRYFRLLEAQRLREVAEDTAAVQREQLENARRRFDAGRLTKNELLVVQVALRNSEQRLLQRDIAVDRSRWDLNRSVGLEVNAPTMIVDVRETPSVAALEEALRTAQRQNPLLVSLLEERQRLEEELAALERSRLPRLSAGSAIDYSSSSIVQPQDVGSGFVGFTWDLGTDTRREAAIAEARSRERANRVALERQLRDLEELVRATRRAAEERLAAFEAAAAAVEQAEENLRIRRQQFDVGRATSEDVLDAEALLAGQRAERATALYDAHVRAAELRQLMGLRLDAPTAAAVPDSRAPDDTTIAVEPHQMPGSAEPPEWTCRRTLAGVRCRRETPAERE